MTSVIWKNRLRSACIVILLVAYSGASISAYGDPPSADPQGIAAEQQDGLRKQPLSYGLGDMPPKLEVNRWTDGRQHSLDEFRGKVIVLEFAGMWCGVCRRAAPQFRKLVAHYKDEDVVFVGIHTPTDDDQGVAKMMSEDGWLKLMAIDERVNVMDKLAIKGKTAASYGIAGWPSIVVLTRTGRVVFSSELFDRTMTLEKAEPIYARCAAKAQIPYPMSQDLSESDKNDWISRLGFEFHREKIDEALLSKP